MYTCATLWMLLLSWSEIGRVAFGVWQGWVSGGRRGLGAFFGIRDAATTGIAVSATGYSFWHTPLSGFAISPTIFTGPLYPKPFSLSALASFCSKDFHPRFLFALRFSFPRVCTKIHIYMYINVSWIRTDRSRLRVLLENAKWKGDDERDEL